MSNATTLIEIVESSPYLIRLSLSLGWTYLNLDRRVNKARRAFEKQLTAEGMSKEDAEKLSACFEDLKNDIVATAKQGLIAGRFS